MLKKIFSNAYVVNMLNKISTLLLGAVSSIFVTRYMGTSIKGNYAYVVSVSAILGILLSLGMDQIYPRLLKQGVQGVKQKIIDIYTTQFVLAEILFLTTALLIDTPIYLYIGILTPITAFTSQIAMVGMVEFPVYRSMSLIISAVVNFIAYIVLYFFCPRHLWFVIVVLALKDLIFITMILIKIKIRPHIFKIDRKFLVEIIKMGFFPMLTALLLNLNYKVDVIMVRGFETSVAAGIYSTAVTIADYLWLVPDSFKEVLFSKSVKKETTGAFNLSIKLSILIIVALSICLIGFGGFLIPFVYGQEFADSYSIICILLIGIPFMSIFKILSPLYISQGDTKSYFLNLLCGVLCNIFLNSMLIPRMGIAGAAIGTVFAQIVCGIFAVTNYIYKNDVSIKALIVFSKEEIQIVKKVFRRKDG